jgi:hypothetical protein
MFQIGAAEYGPRVIHSPKQRENGELKGDREKVKKHPVDLQTILASLRARHHYRNRHFLPFYPQDSE